MPQSQDIRQNSNGGIFDIDDIDMKLGPVTKIDRRNETTSKKFVDDVMSENFVVIVFSPIYGQVGATWKLVSRGIAYKTYIFINSNLLPYKN